VHDRSFTLASFEEIHAQTGVRSAVTVATGGQLHFLVSNGSAADEGPGDPVVVGPTLFGYALAHWAELSRGERLAIRFAVPAAGRSYPFVLELERSAAGTRVWMKPGALWLKLFTGDIWFDLDPATARVLRYQGPVPPLVGGRAVDARVDYTFSSAEANLLVPMGASTNGP